MKSKKPKERCVKGDQGYRVKENENCKDNIYL